MLWAVDRWHEALALVDKALNLSKSLNGNQHVITLRVMQDKADIQSQFDDLDRAEDKYRYVLKVLEANPSDELLFLQATFGLGLIHRRRGDFTFALEIIGRSVDGTEAEMIDKHLTIDWYSNLGYVLSRTSRQQEAEKVLRSAIQTCIDNDLRLLLEHIWPLNGLIRLLCTQGRFEEANELW